MRRALPISLALAGLAAAAAAQPGREALRGAEQARAAQLALQHLAAGRARAAEAEGRRLADARVAAAARLQAVEAEAAEAAARVDALAARRAEAGRRLAERAEALGPVLPLVERLSLYPAETLLAAPAPPESALRGLLVLRALTRQMERDAAALRAEQAEVQSLARAEAAEIARLRETQSEQAAQAAALDRQIAAARQSRDDSEDRAEAAARGAAAAAARADTLRAAIERIEAERERAEARARQEADRAEARAREEAARADAGRAASRLRRDTEAAGARRREADAADDRRREREVSEAAKRQQVAASAAPPGAAEARAGPAPVAGRIVRAWGERTDAGPANGVSYQAPPAARVVAPCGGRVVFAGPFRSFGPMVILDCGGGRHVVLAGLDRLDAQVGRAVQAGEPVGVMPGWEPGSGSGSGSGSQGGRPTLYMELRRDGKPVNPAPFLRARG